jgi:Tat protein secretion system quality control protein TatD with DNase activity
MIIYGCYFLVHEYDLSTSFVELFNSSIKLRKTTNNTLIVHCSAADRVCLSSVEVEHTTRPVQNSFTTLKSFPEKMGAARKALEEGQLDNYHKLGEKAAVNAASPFIIHH